MKQIFRRSAAPDDVVRTPDGQAFEKRSKAPGGGNPALAAVGAASSAALRAAAVTGSAIFRFVRTVWRLAEALDSALWRGAKLVFFASTGFLGASGRAAGAAFAEVFRWLPSKGGRAYAAWSGVVLVISALWAADEIRNARASAPSLDSIFRPPVDTEDPIVARIDGRFVHVSEIEAAARASGQLKADEKLSAETAFERGFVNSFVEQRLLSRAALEEGMHRDPAVQRRINAARDRILASSYMEGRIAAAVTPERVKRVYDSQSDVTRLGDEVKARHILVSSETDALNVIAEIRAGADFAAIARSRSLDRATAPLGGEVGWFTKDMMTPPFAAAAFSTAPGEIAEPFSTEFGWHVLQVEDRRKTGGVPFGAVEDNVKRFLTLRTVKQTIEALKADDDVLLFPPENAPGGTDR